MAPAKDSGVLVQGEGRSGLAALLYAAESWPQGRKATALEKKSPATFRRKCAGMKTGLSAVGVMHGSVRQIYRRISCGVEGRSPFHRVIRGFSAATGLSGPWGASFLSSRFEGGNLRQLSHQFFFLTVQVRWNHDLNLHILVTATGGAFLQTLSP